MKYYRGEITKFCPHKRTFDREHGKRFINACSRCYDPRRELFPTAPVASGYVQLYREEKARAAERRGVKMETIRDQFLAEEQAAKKPKKGGRPKKETTERRADAPAMYHPKRRVK
ncbi:MAG: hypothetical protein H0W63_04035 [Gemmatimonadaceae bacterium]|nr:hypothetical protein [Gemmatimonadaceae bacterium]